jgi:DNA topoisomerase-6 subunit B
MSEREAKAPTALQLVGRQCEISVSDFFLKNLQLLGFDTPAKAVITAVKQALDNALDACEQTGVLLEIAVEVWARFEGSWVAVEDNGPRIVESQISRIFGKLLYGPKFHKLSQSRGQQ